MNVNDYDVMVRKDLENKNKIYYLLLKSEEPLQRIALGERLKLMKFGEKDKVDN